MCEWKKSRYTKNVLRDNVPGSQGSWQSLLTWCFFPMLWKVSSPIKKYCLRDNVRGIQGRDNNYTGYRQTLLLASRTLHTKRFNRTLQENGCNSVIYKIYLLRGRNSVTEDWCWGYDRKLENVHVCICIRVLSESQTLRHCHTWKWFSLFDAIVSLCFISISKNGWDWVDTLWKRDHICNRLTSWLIFSRHCLEPSDKDALSLFSPSDSLLHGQYQGSQDLVSIISVHIKVFISRSNPTAGLANTSSCWSKLNKFSFCHFLHHLLLPFCCC